MPKKLDNPEIFFLTGAVRSGTTVLRLILGHHSRICDCDEMEFIPPILLPVERGGVPLNEYPHWLSLHRGADQLGFDVDIAHGPEHLARSFLKQKQQKDGREIIGANVHNDFDVLPNAFPTARFIFLHRDPRDVAISSIHMGWHGTGWGAANVWLQAQEALARLRKAIPAERLLETRFEELVANPETEVRRVCDFLGVDYEPEMLDIDKDTTYSPPDPAKARSWRDNPDTTLIRQIETRIGEDRLQTAGYEPSGLPPVSTSSTNLRWIQLADFYNRSRFRQRRYGVALWATYGLAKRLPFTKLKEMTQQQVNEIDLKHLK